MVSTTPRQKRDGSKTAAAMYCSCFQRSRALSFWCRRGDSNSHGLRHCPLKTACLPISPRRLVSALHGRFASRQTKSSWFWPIAAVPRRQPPLFRYFPLSNSDRQAPELPDAAGAACGADRRPLALSARRFRRHALLHQIPRRLVIRRQIRQAETRRKEHGGQYRRCPSTGSSPNLRRQTGCPTHRCRTRRPCRPPCHAASR